MNLKQLQQERADAIKAMRALSDTAGTRAFTATEQETFDSHQSRLNILKTQIGREEALMESERELAAAGFGGPDRNPGSRPGDGAELSALVPNAWIPKCISRINHPNTGKLVYSDDALLQGLGRQLQAIKHAGLVAPRGGKIDPRLVEEADDPNMPTMMGPAFRDRYSAGPAGMSEVVPSDGGFLIHPEFSNTILMKMYAASAILGRCNRIPLENPNVNELVLTAINETSRATGSRWGGVQTYWMSEGGAPTATKPTFRQIRLVLNRLAGLAYATDSLLQDASALGTIINQAFTSEFTFMLEDAIFEGTGAGQPLGFINENGPKVKVAKNTGQAARTIDSVNIVNMWSRLFGSGQQNAVWLVNQDVFPQLYQMGITVGTGGAPIFQPPTGLSGSPYSTLFGRPIIPVEYCSTLGTEGDIVLADLSQYITVDRGAMESASSIHVRFTSDEMTFRFIMRFAGAPAWNSALTPFKGTNTQSPIVTLATRA